jgi:hypothetical protein
MAYDPNIVLPDPSPPYPIRLYVMRPDTQSKLLNFPVLGWLIRTVLLVPHLLLMYAVQLLGLLAWWIALWGILFKGRFPRGLYRIGAGTLRWYMAIYCYQFSLYDEWPPMDFEQRPDRELILEVDMPERYNRWLNLPFLPLKFVLAIPHLLILYALVSAAFVVGLIGQFAILFSGSFPVGLHRFVVGVQRWNARMYGYLFSLTDEYPPFSLS